MKDFTSKGISLENMVEETPGKEKGMTGKTSPKTNQTVALTEDCLLYTSDAADE